MLHSSFAGADFGAVSSLATDGSSMYAGSRYNAQREIFDILFVEPNCAGWSLIAKKPEFVFS
jgi:hypothetical protein